MEYEFEHEKRYLRAEKRLNEIKGFYWHLFWYLVVNVFILVMIYMNIDAQERFFTLGHFSTSLFWGIGLFFHWLGVYGRYLFFSKEWEERKIKEFMEKDKIED